MKKTRNTILALLLVVSVFALTGCTTFDNFKEAFFSDTRAEATTIKIGVLEPQTGDDSEYGELEIQGIKIANKLYGKALGKNIELVYADTQSDMSVAETAIKDLIDKKPVLVIGTYGEANSLLASKYLKKAKIPAVAVTSTNPLITVNNPYYFTVSFSDSSQGEAAAYFAYDYLKLNKASVVRMKSEDFGMAIVRKFSDRLAKLTGDENCITTTVPIDPEAKDYLVYVQRIQQSQSKCVFMPVSLNVADKFFAEAQKAGLNEVTFIGTNDWHTDELIAMQKKYPMLKIAALSDVNTTGKADDGTVSELHQQFIKEYKAEYGDSEPKDATALAFDAYMIAYNALETSQTTDGDKLAQAILATHDFQGASGTISFGETGEPEKTTNVDIVSGGKFVTVYTKQ